ncbi:hypothetical protein BS78_06G157300 [Paspalum vaginatum]|nr:hypothetical protein BS78_06G157300 [Paspalum vaginatum]
MINGGITGGLKVLFQCYPYAAASGLHMLTSTYWERLAKHIPVMDCTKVRLDLQLVCSTSSCVFDRGKNRKEGIKMTAILQWPWYGNCRTCSLMLLLPRGRPKIKSCQLPENHVVWMCTGKAAPKLTSLKQLDFTTMYIQMIILLGGSRGISFQLVFLSTKTKLLPVEELTQICSQFITRMLQIVEQFSHGKLFAIGKCIMEKRRKALGKLKNFTNIVDWFDRINMLSICLSPDHAIGEMNMLQIRCWHVNCSSMLLLSFWAPPIGRHLSNSSMEVSRISELGIPVMLFFSLQCLTLYCCIASSLSKLSGGATHYTSLEHRWLAIVREHR